MDLVSYSTADGVAHIELNRPESANAFDLDMGREFAAAVRKAGGDEKVRSVLVSGRGRRFCAGGDVASFAAAHDQPAYLRQLATEVDGAFRGLRELAKPVVGVVHGAVAGAGLSLMLSTDVVVSAPETQFVFAYPAIGLTPDCGLSYLLPRAIGQHRALTFALLGQAISPPVALSWGLIGEIADDATARGEDIALRIANGPATALGQVRRLFRQSWEMDPATTGHEEARTISEMAEGSEARRLIARFVGGPQSHR